jgi:vanillate/4-hydroxybenzoate decarboxylase subunit D
MICKRCDSDKVRKMVDAPVGKAWEVYVCEKCFFSWRSTETIEVLPKFKLNDEKIATMQMIPPIPPLKK